MGCGASTGKGGSSNGSSLNRPPDYKPIPEPNLPFDVGSLGKAKALSVAVRYTGTEHELAGTWHDQDLICDYWNKYFNVDLQNVTKLRDDGLAVNPTKANILEALQDFVRDVESGDRLFFHFSGHGGQVADDGADEEDNCDETLFPVDFKVKDSSTQIRDDALRNALSSLPSGVSCFLILDCCHSGTGADLPYGAKVNDDEVVTMEKKSDRLLDSYLKANVFLLSGCSDSQLSTDVPERGGALTLAFTEAIRENPSASFGEVLVMVRSWMKNNNISDQTPQLSAERVLVLEAPFLLGPKIAETNEKRRWGRPPPNH